MHMMELLAYLRTLMLPFNVALTATFIAILLRSFSAACSSWRRTAAAAAQWPPGPPAWPIVGHLHLLGHLPHQSLCKLAQTYGPLMGLRLGGVPTIVASSPEMAKQILHTHDVVFANHPRNATALHIEQEADMVSSNAGSSTWRRMRQICSQELFSVKRLASFRHVREEEARSLARAVLEAGQGGKHRVELRPLLRVTANDIISRMVMGKKIKDVSSESAKGQIDLLSLVEEIHYVMGVFYIGDFIPWLWWLDPHRYLARMKTAGHRIQALLQDVIDKRLQKHGSDSNSTAEDFLDVLLAQDNFFTSNVRGLLLDMFTGGSQTSAIAIEWALAELINNPQKMHKLQEELNKVVGNSRFVEEEDLKNLPYLAMVVKESLRLHPVGPLLMPHVANQECQIMNYKIPNQTIALVNAWAIARDPSTWENPLEFWPERFDHNDVQLRDSSCTYLAFGNGRRACPGWNLAILTTQLMIATLVQAFTWTNDFHHAQSYNQVIDMSEAPGLLLEMARPLCPFATPVLPLHLY